MPGESSCPEIMYSGNSAYDIVLRVMDSAMGYIGSLYNEKGTHYNISLQWVMRRRDASGIR